MEMMDIDMESTKQVMIVEDDPFCRDRFVRAASERKELSLLCEADCLSDARKCLSKTLPDVLVVDIGLPDGSGIDLIKECKSRNSGLLCLVVTIYGDENHVLNAMAAGASGYLQKDAPLSELGEAIVSILQGGLPISPSIAKALLTHIPTAIPTTDAKETENGLTQREVEVLNMIAKGYCRDEIAEKLHISLNTVSAHTKNIYSKLEVHSGTGAIHKAKNRGWI